MRLVVGLSCLSCNGAGRDHMRLRRVEAEVETLERGLQNDLHKFHAGGFGCIIDESAEDLFCALN